MSRRWFLIRAVMCSSYLVLSVPSYAQTIPQSTVVSLDEARKLHESGQAILIDIRESDEHAAGVAPGARLLPMSQINRRIAEIPLDTGQPVLLICRTQNRSSAVQQALRAQLGERYAHVRYVHGGMSDWAKRGWPLVKPTP